MSTHYDGTIEERSALDAYIKLMRAAISVEGRVNRHLQEERLTPGQFGVLEALYHLGPMNQTSLCEKILTSGGNMTLLLDNLARRNLVERRRDPADRRNSMIYLTEEGRDLTGRTLPRHVQGIVEEFGTLSLEEQEMLGALCRRLGLRGGGVDDRRQTTDHGS